MKKLFTLFFALVAGVGAIFASVQIDGIWYSLYRLNSTGVYYATVTYRGNSYSAYDDEYIDYICYLILNHDSPITDKQIKENYDMCLKLYEIQRCDALAHNPNKLEKRKNYLEQTKERLLIRRGE